jgi:opacity protein-like surface antigen
MFKKSLIALAFSVAVTGSFAQVYVQGGFGKGTIGSVNCTGCTTSNSGNKLLVGYELGNGWALEGQSITYGKVSNLGAGNADISATGFGLGGAYNTLLTDKVSGRIGLSLNSIKFNSTPSQSTSSLNLGLGLGYKISDSISGIVEYDISSAKDNTSGSHSLGLFTFGIRARF